MSTVIVTRSPIAGGTPSPWQSFTITGSASVQAALADSNDGTYIESGSSLATVKQQLMYVIFAPLDLPDGAVIEYIQPVVRERHGQGGWLTVAELHARNSSGVHKTAWSQAPIGTNPADNTWRNTNGPIFTKAADGTEWSDCDPATFTAVLAWGPNWYDTYYSSITNRPALSKVDLNVAYRMPPGTVINGPGGAIDDPRPPVEWETGQTQIAYRVIVVAVGAVDGSGRTAGSTSFDPSTVVQPAHDSGKVYSAVTETVVTDHLTPGASYYFYVRTWAPSIGSTEMPSSWTATGPHAVSAATVTPPTLDLSENTASYSVQAAVTRVAPGGGETAPTYYSLQRWNADEEVWEDVQGAQRLSGPGGWSYFDSTHSAGDTVSYRARGVYVTTTDVEVPSAWVTDELVVSNLAQWWLRDPTDYTLNRRIEVASYSESIPKPQEVAYGAGARGATVTHQGVRLGVHKVGVRTLTRADRLAVRALLDSGRTLVFVTAYGDAHRVQLSDSTEVSIIRAEPIDGETTPIRDARVFNCSFIEVER